LLRAFRASLIYQRDVELQVRRATARERCSDRSSSPRHNRRGSRMNLDITEASGACHCGAIRFQVRLSNGLRSARRCDCSFCRMRGAVVVSADVESLVVLEGEEFLATYQFNTGIAKHHFCRRCGIYTHHQRRSNPHQLGVNVACLAGLSPFDFREVPVNDGVHHPSDTGFNRIAGVLRYFPSEES
jgi:hypothetical protein